MLGHIMRLAAYIRTSRHGIFTFGTPSRMPINPAAGVIVLRYRTCQEFVSLRSLIEAAFLSQTKELFGPSAECRPRGL